MTPTSAPTTSADVLAIARRLLFIREARDKAGHVSNRGRWVEALQRIGGTEPGQPWCACYVSAVLELAFRGASPLKVTAGCDELLVFATAKGWITDTPVAGDVFLVLKTPTDAEHTGFVSDDLTADRFGTIEGNASDPDQPPTREGFGVFERPAAKGRKRSPKLVFIHYPRAL